MNGADLIAAERRRQVEILGWDRMHDSTHRDGSLFKAACCYIQFTVPGCRPVRRAGEDVPVDWPWESEWWKPSPDRIRNLVKAGALIAAEIDRLARLSQAKTEERP